MAILLSDSYKVINWDLNSKMLDTVYWGKTTDSGRGVKVAINQNGVLKTPTTETMRINFKKPSGLQIFIDGVISGNYFVFDFTEQVYAEQGNVSAELMLNVGGEFVMSSTFIIEVNQSFTSAIESSSEFTALQTALADVDEVKNDIIALQNPVFTEASTLANIVSGESQATLWGKVMKFFNNVKRTAISQADLFDIGANLTVTRFNTYEYKCGNGRYLSIDALLAPTGTITTNNVILTFKSGFTPIADQNLDGVKLVSASNPIPIHFNVKATTRTIEFSGINATNVTTGQNIYINARIEL